MLVLSRKVSETVLFPDLDVTIQVLNVKGSKVNVGIDAPRTINIVRGELQLNNVPTNNYEIRSEQARILSLVQEAKSLVLDGQFESAASCLKESLCHLESVECDRGNQPSSPLTQTP